MYTMSLTTSNESIKQARQVNIQDLTRKAHKVFIINPLSAKSIWVKVKFWVKVEFWVNVNFWVKVEFWVKFEFWFKVNFWVKVCVVASGFARWSMSMCLVASGFARCLCSQRRWRL